MTTFTASEVRKLIERLTDHNHLPAVARACLALRAFADRLEADERAEPVMWVDPTTFYDAYPFCVKKLSFMSSDDADAGVEYVALYTHSAQAQPPAARVTDAMVERALSAYYVRDIDSAGFAWEDAVGDPRIAESDMRAALEAALAAQENPNG